MLFNRDQFLWRCLRLLIGYLKLFEVQIRQVNHEGTNEASCEERHKRGNPGSARNTESKEVEEDSDKRHERAAKQPGTSTLIALGCHMPPGLHFYSLYPKGDGSCIGVQIRFFLTRNQCDITMVSANEGTLVRGTWGIWPVEWPPKAQERNVR